MTDEQQGGMTLDEFEQLPGRGPGGRGIGKYPHFLRRLEPLTPTVVDFPETSRRNVQRALRTAWTGQTGRPGMQAEMGGSLVTRTRQDKLYVVWYPDEVLA